MRCVSAHAKRQRSTFCRNATRDASGVGQNKKDREMKSDGIFIAVVHLANSAPPLEQIRRCDFVFDPEA